MRGSKVLSSVAEAVRDIPDGAVIGFGGAGAVGVPINLLEALAERGTRELTCVTCAAGGGCIMPEDVPDLGWLIRSN